MWRHAAQRLCRIRPSTVSSTISSFSRAATTTLFSNTHSNGATPCRFSSTTGTTKDAAEAATFADIGWRWWDVEKNNAVRPLHHMNHTRMEFIRNCITHSRQSGGDTGAVPILPLQGLKILDVGCGGGILSESLARLGATVTGLDINQVTVLQK